MVRKTNRKTMKRTSKKSTRKSTKKSNLLHKSKSVSRPKSQKKSTIRYVRRHRGGFAKGIEGCSYMRVEGMDLPGLKIDNQMALIGDSCKTTPTSSYQTHPNVM